MDAHLPIQGRDQEDPVSILTTGAKSGHGSPNPFSFRDMLAKEQSKLWNIAMHWLLSKWHLGVMQFISWKLQARLHGSRRTEAPNRKARSRPGNGLPPHPTNLEPKNEPNLALLYMFRLSWDTLAASPSTGCASPWWTKKQILSLTPSFNLIIYI